MVKKKMFYFIILNLILIRVLSQNKEHYLMYFINLFHRKRRVSGH